MERTLEQLFALYRRTRRPAVLGELYDRVAPELLHVALHLAGRPADAEDLLQATFAAAIESADRFDESQRVLPWLLGILANVRRSERWRASRSPDPARIERRPPETPDEQAERQELADALDRVLLRVPEPFQPVLILRLRHGLSATEIAHALRRPPGTVRSQLARGLELVRRALPASFAGAALATLGSPARGLDAVRSAVLAHAAAAQPAASLAGAVAGALVMKKAWIVVACALVLVSAVPLWRAASSPADAPREPRVARVPDGARPEPVREPSAEPRVDAERVAAPAPAPTPPAVASEEPTAARAPSGTLLVRAERAAGGAPVAGEVVLVLPADVEASFPRPLRATTGADGVARFERVPAGVADVRLLRGEAGPTEVVAGEERELRLAVPAGVLVEGLVVDAAGAPVAGADVAVSERSRPARAHVVARTAHDGTFALEALAKQSWISASAPGLAAPHARRVVGEPGQRVPMRLVLDRAGAPVRGRVLDADGASLAGALVQLGDDEPRFGRTPDGASSASAPTLLARTGEDGGFALAAVPLGAAPVHVRAAGHAPWSGELAVVAAGPNVLEVRLSWAARAAGVVRDADGAPVAGAEVRSVAGGELASRAYSGAAGAYELGDLPAGTVHLVAELPGRGRAQVELALREGATARWDPVLRSGGAAGAIAGRVVDERGAPVADALVSASTPEGMLVRLDAADGDGRFVLADLPDGLYDVLADDDECAFPLAIRRGVAPGGLELELRARTAATSGRIEGVVLGADGEPAAGARVNLWHEELALWREIGVDAASGAFALERVPPGRWRVTAVADGAPRLALGEPELRAGETIDLGTARLEAGARLVLRVDASRVAPDALATLRCTLLDADGRLVPGALGPAGDGLLRSAPLRPGAYVLRAQGEGLVPFALDFDAGPGAEVERSLALAPAATRRVVLVGASGERAWCEVRDAGGRVVWQRLDLVPAGGEAVADVSLAPGRYRLHCGTAEGLSGSAELEIGAAASRAQAEPLRVALDR